MLLAISLHLTPQASTVHGPRLGNDVQIKHATQRVTDSVSTIRQSKTSLGTSIVRRINWGRAPALAHLVDCNPFLGYI
jgi:hypothetical protein